MHLSPCVEDFSGMALDTTAPTDRSKLIDAMLADIAQLSERFGAKTVILENMPWAPWPPHKIPQPVLLPEVICQVIRQTGCGLVLDIAHASIAARHLGMDAREYLRQLPTDRICEVHVSGTSLLPNGEWDDHYALTPSDLQLTEWAIHRMRAGGWPSGWVMTFEYGGWGNWPKPTDKDTIHKQVPLLWELAKSVPDN